MRIKLTESKFIDIKIINARSLLVRGINTKPVETIDNDITKLNFDNLKEFNIDDTITVENVKYTINYIEYSGNDSYILIDQKLNKSCKYIFPLLFNKGIYASNRMVNKSLFNTYCCCTKYPKFSDGNYLFLKYRFTEDDNYKTLESEITQQNNFIKIDDSDKHFVVFILDIGEKYRKDYQRFWEGRYHMFSPQSEEHILNFYRPSNNSRNYKNIFTPLSEVMKKSVLLIKRIEEKLDVKLPEGIGLESKPQVIQETLIM